MPPTCDFLSDVFTHITKWSSRDNRTNMNIHWLLLYRHTSHIFNAHKLRALKLGGKCLLAVNILWDTEVGGSESLGHATCRWPELQCACFVCSYVTPTLGSRHSEHTHSSLSALCCVNSSSACIRYRIRGRNTLNQTSQRTLLQARGLYCVTTWWNMVWPGNSNAGISLHYA